MTDNYLNYFMVKKLHENVSNRVIFTSCLAILVLIFMLYRKITNRKYKLPPGPKGAPVLGYIPYLGPEPYKELDRLKKIYGNVFSLHLGQTYVVILADFEAVKEAFSKPETSGRPDGLFDLLVDRVGFTSVSGEEWIEQRRFCMKSMRGLGLGREKWESIIQMEVQDFIQIVSSFRGDAVDISNILTSSVSNTISSFILGKRLPFNHPDRMFLDNTINEITKFFTQTSTYSFFPFLQNLSINFGIGSVAKLARRLKKFNLFFRKEAEKYRETYKTEDHDNFIVDYLKEMDNVKGKPGHYFNETNLFGNIQTLLIGASDTTKNALHWLVLIMAKFPEVQDKIRKEVDTVLGNEEKVQWSDRKKLPYTWATIMEGQRWRTIVPLNPARMALADTQIQNYDIPKGTRITVNIWGLHHDPKYWKNPEKFDPDRFLTEDGEDVPTKYDSYIPFSYGKRNCPGDKIAMMEILIYFVSLIQRFRISVPNGKEINMDGEFGLTYTPFPQDLHYIPRE